MMPPFQGMKDPTTDSKSKLAMFKEHCTGVEIKELDAGKKDNSLIKLSTSILW